jgi:hypothetical protein
MEETEKKTSDQEADDLKGIGREGIQLAKELGQEVKKSAGNNAGSLFECEINEGIPAPMLVWSGSNMSQTPIVVLMLIRKQKPLSCTINANLH